MNEIENTIRVPFESMKAEFFRVLLKIGFAEEPADKCAGIFACNSLDGVSSHGINRFPRFVKTVLQGFIKPMAVPSLIHKSGSIEQWNGNLGPGPVNASFATERAMELASSFGIGLVGLANTNHWMRGGTYGWQASSKGLVLICWTNTCQNMPAWGAADPRIGNNPLVISVPYKNEAIVLDFAMSQYSYGKLDKLKREGKQLPFPGGYNKEGKLSSDPGEILESWRVLPTGYWKGSGLSLLLDILAAILSGGLSTHQINDCTFEHGVSQVFIAIDLKSLHNFSAISQSVSLIIDDLHKSLPVDGSSEVRYPGENIVKIRAENLKNGIPVNSLTWRRLKEL